LAAALLRLLPANGQITGGEILLEGSDVLRMDAVELRRIRGSGVSIVFQEPSLALHPTIALGNRWPKSCGRMELRVSESAASGRAKF